MGPSPPGSMLTKALRAIAGPRRGRRCRRRGGRCRRGCSAAAGRSGPGWRGCARGPRTAGWWWCRRRRAAAGGRRGRRRAPPAAARSGCGSARAGRGRPRRLAGRTRRALPGRWGRAPRPRRVRRCIRGSPGWCRPGRARAAGAAQGVALSGAGGAGMFSPRTATGGRCDGPTVQPASSPATPSSRLALARRVRTAHAVRSAAGRPAGTCPPVYPKVSTRSQPAWTAVRRR